MKNKKIKLAFIILVVLLLIAIFFTIKYLNKTAETFSESNTNDVFSTNISDSEEIFNIILSPDENLGNEEPEITDNVPKENNTNTNTTSSQKNVATYYIKVNYTANVVTIYSKDANGNYTVPVKAMVCSTGSATPKSGVYKIPGRWQWGALFDGVYGQYVTKITGNILFHSVPYLENRNPTSLEYWEYDKLGTTASAGCVRLTVSDALWIYQNCSNGTQEEFYSSNDPGPLGKPSARKISNYNAPYCNWDPTDPNSKNPWKNGTPTSSNTTNEENNVITNTTIETNTNNIVDTNTTTENNTNSIVDTNTTAETNTNNIVNTNTTETNTNSIVDTNTVTETDTNNIVANNVVANK